jgi:hypothetical protein
MLPLCGLSNEGAVHIMFLSLFVQARSMAGRLVACTLQSTLDIITPCDAFDHITFTGSKCGLLK